MSVAERQASGLEEGLLNLAERLLGHLPKYVTIPIGLLIVCLLITGIAAAIALALGKIVHVWETKLRPTMYGPEERQRAKARRLFAQHLTYDVTSRNRTENWRDQEFAELEAEVEAQGRTSSFIRWPFSRRDQLRREKSLSAALRKSCERLILVEGEPGSGKSVALRHVALQMAAKAEHSRSTRSHLPVYINLKELSRDPTEIIDRSLVRKHVLYSLNRISDSFVDTYLEDNFDENIRNGSWVFFFDSFDEIPDVLASTQSDDIIAAYTSAIDTFLAGMTTCRGIVASRSYKSPAQMGWTTFRLLPLSTRRQDQLISKSIVNNRRLAKSARISLATANSDIREMAKNPMLLGLLCEHVKLESPFPETAHEVMSQYVSHRLNRDETRILVRFDLTTNELRELAETVAYVMTADSSIGLSPSVSELISSVHSQGFTNITRMLSRGLSALSYMKIGRIDDESNRGIPHFTFSHRRFQEYFATRVVVSNPDLVPAEALLCDARWRETAVVLLQSNSPKTSESINAFARSFLSNWNRQTANQDEPTEAVVTPARSDKDRWQWPRGSLHVLGILDAGARLNPAALNQETRECVSTLLTTAFNTGHILDKKYVIEISGAAEPSAQIDMMERSLAEGSRLIDDVVYNQASRISTTSSAIISALRASIVRMYLEGVLTARLDETRAYISRLPNSRELMQVVELCRWSFSIDAVLLSLVSLLYFADFPHWSTSVLIKLVFCNFLILVLTRRLQGSEIGRAISYLARFMVIIFVGMLLVDEIVSEVVEFSFSSGDARREHLLIVLAWIAKLTFALGVLVLALTWPNVYREAALNERHISVIDWPFLPARALYSFMSRISTQSVHKLVSGAIVYGIIFLIVVFVIPRATFIFMIFYAAGGILSAVIVVATLIYMRDIARDQLAVRRFDRSGLLDSKSVKLVYMSLITNFGAIALLRRVLSGQLSGELRQWREFATFALAEKIDHHFYTDDSGIVKSMSSSSGALRVHRDLLYILLDRAADAP